MTTMNDRYRHSQPYLTGTANALVARKRARQALVDLIEDDETDEATRNAAQWRLVLLNRDR
jgi:hypothetical protein